MKFWFICYGPIKQKGWLQIILTQSPTVVQKEKWLMLLHCVPEQTISFAERRNLYKIKCKIIYATADVIISLCIWSRM